MKFIVYVSQAARPFDAEALGSLLAYSRARNAQDGVTGLLVYRYNSEYRRGNFLQVLEGPDAMVDDVWTRISKDKRHHTVLLLEEGPIAARMFGDWSMGCRNVEDGDLREYEGFTDMGSDAFWEEAQRNSIHGSLTLLRDFYDRR